MIHPMRLFRGIAVSLYSHFNSGHSYIPSGNSIVWNVESEAVMGSSKRRRYLMRRGGMRGGHKPQFVVKFMQRPTSVGFAAEFTCIHYTVLCTIEKIGLKAVSRHRQPSASG